MTKDMIVKAAQEAAARRNEVFALNDLRVDLTARRVWKNGKPVRLTPREYALLEMLIRKRDLVLTRGELLTTAWGYEYVVPAARWMYISTVCAPSWAWIRRYRPCLRLATG